MSAADAMTLAFYDRESAAYAAWSPPKGESADLVAFLAASPPGRLLDYGCGCGWAAKRMLAAGREVEAFDGSAALAAEAARATGLEVRTMRFEEFDAPGRYAGIWASFCLLHAPRAEMAPNLARIARALVPGGLLYLGLKAGEGEARDRLGRLYAYYGRGEIGRLLAGAGFSDAKFRAARERGFEGAESDTLHILARKPV